jgi:hypothetical protein
MELSFGQRYDEGLIQPWFTHGALDEIKGMDLSDKNVIMFGSGMGDKWLSQRCKKLVIVERKEEWYSKGASIASENMTYLFRPCNDSDGKADYYLEIPNDTEFDVIINDDSYRTECCEVAIDYFKKRNGGILICDNYWQDFVWKSPIAIEWLEPFEKHIHIQENHTDFENEGCSWKTAIIFIK